MKFRQLHEGIWQSRYAGEHRNTEFLAFQLGIIPGGASEESGNEYAITILEQKTILTGYAFVNVS
jgi:hypothetical protein